MFTTAEPTWEKEHITDWTVVPSTTDPTVMVAAARKVAESKTVGGVVCWGDAPVGAAAEIASALGLPTSDPAAVQNCRDKHRTRVLLEAADVPQPISLAVDTLEEARQVVGRTGYPAVIKPRGYGGSFGVVRVDGPEDLTEHFMSTRSTTDPHGPAYEAPVLVEEYLDGPEISVDSVIRDGKVTPVFVARKVIGYPPHFEEIGHYVDAGDELLTSPELAGVLTEIHSALGFTHGVTHSEFKLTPTGMKLIEVNARAGGDLIPYLGMLATGIDPGVVTAAVSMGEEADLTASRKRVAGIRFYYADKDDTTIADLRFEPSLLPPAIERTYLIAAPGDTVSPPPKGMRVGRVAYATAVAETIEECRTALDAAGAALRIDVA
ncbi:ATP-grasp domain-containing protein [Streptomyces sp. NPDC058307]|uniref:ATP-grasp domain-containing protein n=1 Tax=Streptomyces sp. NPDC058307 TaxID=3346439 RepID=UPI0036E8B3B1